MIALEGAEHGVTSNCINPAYVRTPLVEQQIADQAKAHGIPESEVVETIMLAPAAPSGSSSLGGRGVRDFLCTSDADSITGASLTMDGGWTAH